MTKANSLLIAFASLGAMVIETAASATPVGVPEPEVGFGIAAAAVVAGGYRWLKGRIGR